MNQRSQTALAVISAALLAFAPSFAKAESCDPYECETLCATPFENKICDLEVSADFLFWKPGVDDLTYVTDNDNYVDFCPDWEPGIRGRVALSDLFCGWGINGSYTYLYSDKNHSFSDPGALTSPVIPGALLLLDQEVGVTTFDEVSASWSMTYQEWDALFSNPICYNKRHLFTPFFGAAGIDIRQRLSVNLSAGSGTDVTTCDATWRSDFSAVGMRVGAGYTYSISDCLRIFSSTHGSILAGTADSRLRGETVTPVKSESIEFKDDDCLQFVPGWTFDVGAIYNTPICNCWDLSVKIGYEFVIWHNLPNNRIFSNSSNVSGAWAHGTSSNVRTIGFHGLMAGAALKF